MSDRPGPLSRAAESLLERLGLNHEHLFGFRFAVNVFIAATIVWAVLKQFHVASPIWALASMIAAADPQPEEARRMFRSRILNVLVGCGVGFFFLLLGGHGDWELPLVLAVTVLISTYVVRIKTMWRQAPITAAIIIAAGISQSSELAGLQSGLRKVGQVLFGCIVGMLVSWAMSKVWLIKPKPKPAAGPV